MSEHIVYWVGWVKNGYISTLKAGPYTCPEKAEKKAAKLNETDRFKQYQVVYQTIDVSVNCP